MRDFFGPGRSPAVGDKGMVATSHPAAAVAGLEILKAGGNAMDAALTTAAMLSVVEPHMTGIGGDCFAIVAQPDGATHGVNGSGKTPAAAEIDAVAAALAAHPAPSLGPDAFSGAGNALSALSAQSVTIPGAVDAWCGLHDRFASLPLDRLFAPAIAAAADGMRITPRVHVDWVGAVPKLAHDPETKARYLVDGAAPAMGSLFAAPKLAETLQRIARDGRAGFYEGPVAEDMVARLRASGGLHTLDDFVGQDSLWVAPIAADYRGTQVLEIPPNGQGIGALLMLQAMDELGLHADRDPNDVDLIDAWGRLTREAYALRDAFVGDPDHLRVPTETLLGAATRDRLIAVATGEAEPGSAVSPLAAEHQDTVYLCVVDRDGMAVSFINSLFEGFGTGMLAPQSGVMLHCRGMGFRMEPGHPNSMGPGKRPMHTIIPGMAMRDGKPLMPFGVMGGHYQSAGHAHVMGHMMEGGRDPQEAIDLPRHFAHLGVLQLEAPIPQATADALAARGWEIARPPSPIGGGQAIFIDHARGCLIGGSDPRKDGCALGW